MVEDVRRCVDARVNFFDEYFIVPQEMQAEVAAFVEKITALGQSCTDAAEFETQFASCGLSDEFNALLPKCTPKPHKMTKEEKEQSRAIAREMLAANKKEILTDIARDAADTVRIYAESEMIQKNRERMIEEGTMGEYTRTRNTIEDTSRLVGFLKRKFKK